jgi:spore coat polysaccharide biosynthesis protein SpsF (cytidylyltransferase family)
MCTCKKADKKKRLCTCPCTCKEISNLIFRKGAIIITGARSWDQVLDSYHSISKILISEYDNIVSKQADPPLKRNKIINSVVKDEFTYILPSYIRSNPKNIYLIEKYGIDHIK